MTAIKVMCEVEQYPDSTDSKGPPLLVRNHWNLDDRVVLDFGDGKQRVFIAEDLRKAIQNAVNAHRL